MKVLIIREEENYIRSATVGQRRLRVGSNECKRNDGKDR